MICNKQQQPLVPNWQCLSFRKSPCWPPLLVVLPLSITASDSARDKTANELIPGNCGDQISRLLVCCFYISQNLHTICKNLYSSCWNVCCVTFPFPVCKRSSRRGPLLINPILLLVLPQQRQQQAMTSTTARQSTYYTHLASAISGAGRQSPSPPACLGRRPH